MRRTDDDVVVLVGYVAHVELRVLGKKAAHGMQNLSSLRAEQQILWLYKGVNGPICDDGRTYCGALIDVEALRRSILGEQRLYKVACRSRHHGRKQVTAVASSHSTRAGTYFQGASGRASGEVASAQRRIIPRELQ